MSVVKEASVSDSSCYERSGSLASIPFPAFLSLSLSRSLSLLHTPLHTSLVDLDCCCGVVAVSFFQLLHISRISLSSSSQSPLPFHIAPPPPAFACLHTRISLLHIIVIGFLLLPLLSSSQVCVCFFLFQAVILFSSQTLSACVGFCFVIDSSGLQLAAFSSFSLSLSLSLLAAPLSCFCVLVKHFPPPPSSLSLSSSSRLLVCFSSMFLKSLGAVVVRNFCGWLSPLLACFSALISPCSML